MNIYNLIITSFTKIKFNVDNIVNFNVKDLIFKNDEDVIAVDNYKIENNTFIFNLKSEINIKKECFLIYENLKIRGSYHRLFITKEFNDKYYCNSELGYKYTKDYTSFRIWSPAASNIFLLIYKNGDDSIEETPKKIQMKSLKHGLWYYKLNGDFNGCYYTYEINVYNNIYEAVDPYAIAIGINGLRGAIIDLSKSNPEHWHNDISPRPNHFTDAIIYETNVRDISIHPISGIFNKGKYLGLCEENTYSNENMSTGLSHLKELGITHIQLMPVFDFSYKSVDEKNIATYNWGYDPQNYNVPEGIYSTNPFDPYCRIQELKKMIMILHKNGFCVNLDVVFNHLWHTIDNNFQKIFPGYYFRYYNDGSISNGSGCDNDTASENPMMRKFMLDSIKFWVKEYHIDGFRFDLMGLHDINTMNFIRKELDKIDSSIMLYGEGWSLKTALPNHKKACKENSIKMPGIGHFNDIFRDCLKGSIFIHKDIGYVTGKNELEEIIKNCISASLKLEKNSTGIFNMPYETINYASCHDNHTLWDKINLSCENESFDNKKYMHKLCNAIILTSQGIPFLHCGVEFCRTKHFIENSFKSGDDINWIDWSRKFMFLDVFKYYKELINLRKSHASFRMYKKEDIEKHLLFLDNLPKNVVAFILKNYPKDIWKNILVVYNPNKNSEFLKIPNKTWNLIATRNYISSTPIQTFISSRIQVEPISMTILYSND